MKTIKVIAFLLFTCSLSLQAQEQTQDIASLSAQEITKRLPADADLKRIDAQRRALIKGFYWTQSRGIRPLPKVKDSSAS